MAYLYVNNYIAYACKLHEFTTFSKASQI